MSSARTSERSLAQAAVDHLARILQTPWNCLWLVNPDNGLRFVARRTNIARSLAPVWLPIDCVAGTVVSKGLVSLADASQDPLWRRREFTRATGLRAYVGARLEYQGAVLGVLESMRPEPKLFSRRAVQLVIGLATLTGLSLGIIHKQERPEKRPPWTMDTLALDVATRGQLTLDPHALRLRGVDQDARIHRVLGDIESWHCRDSEHQVRHQIDRAVGRALVDRSFAARLLGEPALAVEAEVGAQAQYLAARQILRQDLGDFARQIFAHFWGPAHP